MNRRNFLAISAFSLPALQSFGKSRGFAGMGLPMAASATPDAGGASTVRNLYIPRPQFWSFDNQDPRFQVAEYTLSFQVYTLGANENTYGLDKNSIARRQEGDSWVITAKQLAWPGQQMTSPGTFEARCVRQANRLSLQMRATAGEKVRGIKVRLHNLPKGMIGQTGWEVEPHFTEVPETAVNFNYPEYQGGMPVWFLRHAGDQGISFASMDHEPRPKRFIIYPSEGEGLTAELLVDESGHKLSQSFTAPDWIIERNTTISTAINARAELLERQAGLKPWEQRQDVPAWTREVTLVATLHGMHWSGYIFNDYARMLERVRWVTDRIPGRKVMFFLPGWEGRYYRQYGDSRPEPRMGGAEGFRRLIHGIHERGAHAMAMFSGNYPSPGLPHYEEYAKGSEMHALPGNLRWSDMRGYVVDWGEIRAGATGGLPLNPGAPGWRDWLTAQISSLNRAYGLDGTFLDTQPSGDNTTDYSPLEGLRSIADRLRAEKEDLLLATESWFDLSLPIIPTSQTPDGPGHWSRRYQRRWAHLSMGEPSRGSTGVHELGHLPYQPEQLRALYDWRTVAFVEDTVERAPDKVEAVLNEARGIA